MNRAKILVVDDKKNMLKLFAKILDHDYELTTAAEGGHALSLIEAQNFDIVVTDLKMPGANGLEVLKAVKQRHPDTEVIMMTAYATVDDAVEAMKLGAYDYLQKPFDPDDAVLTIARALERKRLKEQSANLRKELQSRHCFHNIIGKSKTMQNVFLLMEKAAGLDITVLLTGETGTGKELAARAIHYQSARKDHSFIPVNCGALPTELVESELFGHAKGAFTGANNSKPGLFEEANGGTIFLDEIGELPLNAQVKLNRVLQEKEIRRVGGNTATTIDVRIIAATHRDLKTEFQNGQFREDLFYRLNVFPLRMPSLKERKEDIPLLASHFLNKYTQSFNKKLTGLTPDALKALTEYTWPGNVRELEHALERAVAITNDERLHIGDLPEELCEKRNESLPIDTLIKLPYRKAQDTAKDHFTRDYLVALLREFEGNVTRAAGHAAVERESLHRLLKRYNIRSDDFKPQQ